MGTLLKNVINCVWHAFDSLNDNDKVHKSKLKVLTANIGTLLDLYGVEKGLDHYKAETELTFQDYERYLNCEVFSNLPKTLSLTVLREFESKISEVCWYVCQKKLLVREKDIFNDYCVFKLFRIFCLLADMVVDENGKYEVTLPQSEASLVIEQLVQCLGIQFDENSLEWLPKGVKWNHFLSILESKYCAVITLDKDAISEAVHEIYEIFIKDIIKKGYLMKKGYLLPTMREYWFVLQPCELSYYKSSSEREQCGRIELTPRCSVDSAHDQKFTLTTPDRSFELATQDHKSRLQWVSAIQLAISVSCGSSGYQRGARARRRLRRDDRLMQEVKARHDAEKHAKELAELAKEESKKLLELQEAQAALQKLLQEETQAKEDEEIVRALQARVLAEEWEKREELERLQEEQRRMLEEERLKRLQFEERQANMEATYKEAEERLQQLEMEKQRLDEELKKAQLRIQFTEKSAMDLEVQLRELSPPHKHGDRVRRAVSFIPTSKSCSDTYLDLRAETIRRKI